MILLQKFLRQTARFRSLLVEAVLCLVSTRLALHMLPFKRVAWFLNRQPSAHRLESFSALHADHQRLRKEVTWAIERASRYLPGETVCFPRGIAAQAMMRRRGVETTLYYGAATLPGRGLTAHVWVMEGSEGVIGHQKADGFHVLARYPELYEPADNLPNA